MARAGTHDWHALKAEWLQGTETLNQFRERHGFATNWFYRKTNEMGWEKSKNKIITKLESNLISRLAKEWMKPFKISDRIEGHVQAILDQHGNDKKIHTPIEPDFLEKMAKTINTTVKTKKLILGEPTGEENNLDIQSLIVQQININTNGKKSAITDNSETIDAEIVDPGGSQERSSFSPEDAQE